jgi:adenine-specific DNA-methyltransferase
MGKKKSLGQIYTPIPIIGKMLNLVQEGSTLIRKHIIDNSCGDGRFLINTLYQLASNLASLTDAEKKEYLETYIHGIELDEEAYRKTLNNLDSFAKDILHINENVNWDILNCDALSCHQFDGRMDIVIGNPPYVRVHNLECDLSGCTFTEEGMSDLYLAFYELGFRMLSENGQLCYITPSSWYTSVAGGRMRDYIREQNNLDKIIDFGSEVIFEGVSTYVSITHFKKNTEINTICFEDIQNEKEYTLSLSEATIDGNFYFSDKETLSLLKEVFKKKDGKKRYTVKNGYATLADDLFINTPVSGNCTIKVLKSSTGKQYNCIYPYKEDATLLTEEEFKEKSPEEYEYLFSKQEDLLKRKTEYPWYAFGRTQALKDTYREKYAVSNLINSTSGPRMTFVAKGTGVYSGLYVISNGDITNLPQILDTDAFRNYVISLRKYKSGGYYTFSSKDLENYLNTSKNIENFFEEPFLI